MTRRGVFVDTWAWLAWTLADDPSHGRAQAWADQLRTEGAWLLTSNFVLAEALTRLRYDASLPLALGVADAVAGMAAAGRLSVRVVDDILWQSALTWFRRYEDQKFSFVDCTSFAIMAAEGIQEVLTADHHFATAGFTPLG